MTIHLCGEPSTVFSGRSGGAVQTFVSARDFLDSEPQDRHACLVLDVALPGLSGLDLQSELIKNEIQIPVIFITGHADVPTSVRAMKAGAVEFLTKPFEDEDLWKRSGKRSSTIARAASNIAIIKKNSRLRRASSKA